MRIAITGASGHVGHAILEMALGQGHSVVSIDRVPPTEPEARASFVQADITDYAAFELALRDCEALVHMAAIPFPGRQPDHLVHNNNVVGSYNALRAAAELGIRRVCQASSVNATGLVYSRWPRFEYFPLDEQHPTYNEDPYSLSKWICEQQAESIARRYEGMTIASMRFHWVVPERATAAGRVAAANQFEIKQLWGYSRFDSAAQACLLSLTAEFKGAEAFYIVAPDTTVDTPSLDLARQYFPDVPVRGDLSGRRGFFDCTKAERLLGWTHPAGDTEASHAHSTLTARSNPGDAPQPV